jgi:hypothetical protein
LRDNIEGLSGAVSIDTNGALAQTGAVGQADSLAQNGALARNGALAQYGPLRQLPGVGVSVRAPRRTRWWVEALAIVWLCWVYDTITNLAPLRNQVAIGHAEGILRLEQTLHIDPEHALDSWLAGHHTLGLILSDYYDNAHFVVTLGLLAWLWWRRADLYRPLRNSLVLVNVLGFIVFWLYPVAPPRLLVSQGFTDVVASTHAFGSWHTGALASQANQLAAMPSLHMAWAAWCGLALWRISERSVVRVLAVLYPCLTALAVIATGNHFVLDLVGGLVAMGLAVLIVEASAAPAAGLAERLRVSTQRLRS